MTSHRPIAFRRTGAEKRKLIRSERRFGAMHRSFAVRRSIDEAKAEARYADGVLTGAGTVSFFAAAVVFLGRLNRRGLDDRESRSGRPGATRRRDAPHRASSRRMVAPASLDGAVLIGALHLCLTWVKLSRLWAGKLDGVSAR